MEGIINVLKLIKAAQEYLPFIGFGFSFLVFIIAFSAEKIKKIKTKNKRQN